MVRWRFKYRKRLCRGRLPRLPTVTDIGNASTNIQHQTSNPFPRESVAALPYTEVLHIKPAHRAERGLRRRPEAPAPRKCRQLCKYGSHGRLGGGRRRIPREAKCEGQMGYHRKAITFPRADTPARRSSIVSIVNLFIASLRPKTIHSRQRKACSINTWALRKPHAQTAARVNQPQCTKQVRHLHTMLKKHGWQSQNLFQASCQHREPHPGRQSYPHWMA